MSVAEPCGARTLLTLALEQAEAGERGAIARKVRDYINRSGLTQTEFAAKVGTSPSRLSTYASGRVIPSALMMERMQRASLQSFL